MEALWATILFSGFALEVIIRREKDGIVRKYVLTYLKGLQEVADKIIVIVNGKLSLEGKEKLEKLGITILQRANKGFDFGAWKAAFEFLGWEEVRKFDELVLTNCSNYGPVYHFSGIFKRMEDNPCDFWGLTQRQEVKNALIIAGDKDSYIRRHIQSFFIVILSSLLNVSSTGTPFFSNPLIF